MISLEKEIEEYLRLANTNFDLSVDVSFEYAYKGLQLIIQTDDVELKVDYLNILGRCHLERGNLTKSLNYFKKALELAIKLNKESTYFCECYNYIGRVYQSRSEYGKSLEYYSKSLEYYLPSINATTYNNIASIYKQQGQYNLALKAAEDSFSLAKQYNKAQLPRTLSNLGNIYWAIGNKQQAIQQHQMSLNLASHTSASKRDKHFILLQLGNLYSELNDVNTAKEYYNKALELAKSIIDPIALTESRAIIGEIFLKEKKFQNAIDELLPALDYAKKHENIELIIRTLKAIVKAYKKLNEIEQAFDYQSILNNTLQNQLKRDNYQNLNQIIEEKEVLIETLREQNSKISDQQSQLEQTNRELQELNFAFSHYLKEPLRQVNSFVGLMQRELGEKINDTEKEYFSYIKEGSERIQSLLNDLLQYTTIKDDLRIEQVNMNEIIELVRDNLKKQILESKAIFELEELPIIQANTYYICLLFQHLISNSIKFSKPKKPAYIKISYSKEVLDHLFCFEDNGIGIEKQYLNKIFSIFNRLERSTYQSTGIGLAICRKIVEMHNGKIWVESEVGKGTKVYFTIRM